MTFRILSTNKFDKEFKLMLKRGKDRKKLDKFIDLIEKGLNQDVEYHLLLPNKYRLHKLSNNYSALWECHLEPDWLLVFELNNKTLILENTGSHSDLFKS
ncbi:type II toxin-antitoxin system YafQ family toxin [Candidatus Tisiphia endosymbiont of Myopa tessellatipennis]